MLTGEPFQVRVVAVGLSPFVSIEIVVAFDPAALQLLDADPTAEGIQVAPGPFPPSERTVTWINQGRQADGLVEYAVVLNGPVPEQGDGVVAVIPFRGIRPGATHIGFQTAVLASVTARRLPVYTEDTSVTLYGDAIPTPTSDLPPTVPATPTGPAPGDTPTAPVPGDTPTAPAPGDTPTAPPPPTGCQQVLVNGGFEAHEMGWTFGGSPAPGIAASPILTGARSLRVGPASPPGAAGTSAAWQAFDVPPWASTIDVSAWAWQRSTGPGGTDAQMMLLSSTDPALGSPPAAPAGIVFREVVESASWRRWSLTTGVQRFGAPRMWVYAAVANDGRGGRAWMNLDEVAVTFCP